MSAGRVLGQSQLFANLALVTCIWQGLVLQCRASLDLLRSRAVGSLYI